ncbi:lipoprotein YdaJ [Gracilibacillus sp. S3-1-1]|uniref:Lipoprotein YdaJ n=1 Tax=Gracilibacillus pellucidus TaxID=3095368 RepID=A0ACC6M6H4_9BACI|nr:lipoprotein YdaJ [Gracilibacillus sp. S3-1-1]MDX8046442.1 lipoprotein YdaJ [Gracilibacillus sp. S3-1-1]
MKGSKITFIVVILVVLIVIGLFLLREVEDEQPMKEALAVESFIKSQLYKADGLIKTDLLDESTIYLSESIGLWMEYLIDKNDSTEFAKQFQTLSNHFLSEQSLIPWRIENETQAEANAVIDDLRIMKALLVAGEKWNDKKYTQLAADVGKSIAQFNIVDDYFIDHVNLQNNMPGDFLTLSYLDADAITMLYEHGWISEEQYERNRDLLINAPISSNGFFPKTYYPTDNHYEFDDEVNLIDQYYVGYHRAKWGGDVSELVQFTKDALREHDDILYGRFSNTTGEPVVTYEGASVYGLAILMCMEGQEIELANQLYSLMKEHQVLEESSPYNGGYMDLNTLKTHSFDNLIPLIAERRGMDENIF